MVAKFIGIDLGGRKVGIAMADMERKLAKGIKTIPRTLLEVELEKFINQNEIAAVVMGLPRNMDGTDSKSTEEVIAYTLELEEKFSIKIHLQDERLTSWLARDVLREMGYKTEKIKELEDQMAAQIILQEYLNQNWGVHYST